LKVTNLLLLCSVKIVKQVHFSCRIFS